MYESPSMTTSLGFTWPFTQPTGPLSPAPESSAPAEGGLTAPLSLLDPLLPMPLVSPLDVDPLDVDPAVEPEALLVPAPE
jgi:hypothetical protein